MARCDLTDLPADQCSHCLGHTEVEDPAIRWEGSDTEARWPGTCAHCGDRYTAGTRIVCADVDGNGSDEWCIYDHSRSATEGYA